ncbi:ATP-binding protein [Bailinhaonella thermotolerans]|uniref:ATP-binding protein n=1 Tax=Bailinhaonella thermotolerans TaxID=1070861 RepID=A0A3A4AWP4_9ACTN|nr:ATP-binding protein [Bailinhaonella thermotolerans]RJL30357.1 ATP-binding protein [Bailinhaonella thermotolerans]
MPIDVIRRNADAALLPSPRYGGPPYGRGARAEGESWRRAFAGDPREAGAARGFVRFLLEGFPRRDDVVQVVAEFVANALQHTASGAPGGAYVVEVCRWGDAVTVAVSDEGGESEPSPLPYARSADELREGGRGLLTVAATASEWGWYGNARGRTFTALFHG